MKTTGLFFILALTLAAQADENIHTREQLLANIANPAVSPERRYAELDLNGDGTHELILSESVSLGGTGGLIYNLYLGVGSERFKKIDQLLAGNFAVEVHGDTVRLWAYSHSSAQSGSVQYCYFDRNGRYQKSRVLTIHPGDGGSAIGNAIYKSIFNENTILSTKKIGASD